MAFSGPDSSFSKLKRYWISKGPQIKRAIYKNPPTAKKEQGK